MRTRGRLTSPRRAWVSVNGSPPPCSRAGPVLGYWVKPCATRLGIRKRGDSAARLPKIKVLARLPGTFFLPLELERPARPPASPYSGFPHPACACKCCRARSGLGRSESASDSRRVLQCLQLCVCACACAWLHGHTAAVCAHADWAAPPMSRGSSRGGQEAAAAAAISISPSRTPCTATVATWRTRTTARPLLILQGSVLVPL